MLLYLTYPAKLELLVLCFFNTYSACLHYTLQGLHVLTKYLLPTSQNTINYVFFFVKVTLLLSSYFYIIFCVVLDDGNSKMFALMLKTCSVTYNSNLLEIQHILSLKHYVVYTKTLQQPELQKRVWSAKNVYSVNLPYDTHSSCSVQSNPSKIFSV